MSGPTQPSICPKCQFLLPAPADVCPKCGLIFAKWTGPRKTSDPLPIQKSTRAPAALWEWQRKGNLMSPEQLSTLQAWAAQGALDRSDRFRPVGEVDWQPLSEVSELVAHLPEAQKLAIREKESAKRRSSTSFEHATVVLRLKEKGFAMSRKDLLDGIDVESASALEEMGTEGWEMVAAVPFSTGGASMSFTGSANKTDAVLAFFKRMMI
jgi:hypothetical protein